MFFIYIQLIFCVSWVFSTTASFIHFISTFGGIIPIWDMVTFPVRLVTFPRCPNHHFCANSTLISLKFLVDGDIVLQQVEKLFRTVEVIATQLPIHAQMKMNIYIKAIILQQPLMQTTQHFPIIQSFSPITRICALILKTHRTPIYRRNGSNITPQATLKSFEKTKVLCGGVY
jgi:hypothetical protein